MSVGEFSSKDRDLSGHFREWTPEGRLAGALDLILGGHSEEAVHVYGEDVTERIIQGNSTVFEAFDVEPYSEITHNPGDELFDDPTELDKETE